jgi:large subunit ribosomal protein L4
MRLAALRSALSVKAADSGIVVVEEINAGEMKTKAMASTLNLWVGAAPALLVMPVKDAAYEDVTRLTNNIPDAKVMLVNYLNIRDLLGFEKVVLPLKSLDALSAHLGKE